MTQLQFPSFIDTAEGVLGVAIPIVLMFLKLFWMVFLKAWYFWIILLLFIFLKFILYRKLDERREMKMNNRLVQTIVEVIKSKK